MATTRASRDVAVAVLAKAPLPGLAKTRLIPSLGAERAAALQARLIARAVETAIAAGVGPVTLWATPDASHPLFQQFAPRISCACQPEGDLGARMLAAFSAAGGPALLIGTDCPALTADYLRASATILREGVDVAIIATEDGGYALIGMNRLQPALLIDMPWSTPQVMAETCRRLARLHLSWRVPARLWDVDVPDDLGRLRAEMPDLLDAL